MLIIIMEIIETDVEILQIRHFPCETDSWQLLGYTRMRGECQRYVARGPRNWCDAIGQSRHEQAMCQGWIKKKKKRFLVAYYEFSLSGLFLTVNWQNSSGWHKLLKHTLSSSAVFPRHICDIQRIFHHTTLQQFHRKWIHKLSEPSATWWRSI